MRRMVRLLVMLAVVAAVIGLLRMGRGPSIEAGSVLLLDIGGHYVEQASEPLLAKLTGQHRTPLVALTSQLRKAQLDSRIKAVVLRIRPLDVGWGKAHEIRDAIVALRDAGRRPIAWMEIESFGSSLEYFVASGAEEVWMAPGTRAPIVGLAAEYLFFGGLWEKIGVQIDVERIGEFKSAAETYAGKAMSDPNRVMVNSLLDSVSGAFVSAVAKSRGITEDEVKAAIDAAPVTPEEMKERKLVDGVAFLDDVVKMQGDSRPLVKGSVYAGVDPSEVGFDPKATFALVYGTGGVVQGDDGGAPREPRLASEAVSRALEDAANDAKMRAIVFRIDSPGGSALASDIVWRAVQQARKKKPVVVSMSDVAASGGYYVAAGADAIVAQPTTLTGSIGVFVLRPMVSGALDKLGIGFASIQRGRHAGLLLSTQPLTPETRARLEAEVQSVYAQFTGRVADGRKMEVSRVDELGRGRVWTGAQAREAGLVDELGGLRKAVEVAKQKAGVAEGDDVALLPYPPPQSLSEQIREALGQAGVSLAENALGLPPTPRLVQRALSWISALPEGPAVVMPFAVEIR